MAKSSHPNPYFLEAASIDWGTDGVPRADTYGDIYFSQESGIHESRHVFLIHNQLTERWKTLDTQQSGRFTIIETGFGTGLNFLLAWQLWQSLAPSNWQLHFISVEKHPLHPADLRRAHAYWPELTHLASILQHNYPPLLPGQHRRMLNSAQVCLDLLFGDALECLPALLDSPSPSSPRSQTSPLDRPPCVDAWFLDGFSPASNPDMWHDTLFSCMGALSDTGTTFATFTSAGFVKRGLRGQGFAIEKVTGYGRKREMLRGTFKNQSDADAPKPETVAVPWHRPSAASAVNSAIVIGAGLAGCSTARALAQRGIKVTVIERNTPASGASGNPQGVLYTKLSPAPGDLNQFTLTSFLHALAHYRERLASGVIEGELCGVLQLANSKKDAVQFDQLKNLLADQDWLQFLSGDELEKVSGVALNGQAFYYPNAGWLSPPSVCNADLDHPNIRLITHCEGVSLSNAENGQWCVLDDKGQSIVDADAVIVANSNDALQFSQTQHLPIKPIRGQLSYLNESDLTQIPQCVICHEGYLAPPIAGKLCIGASFTLRDSDTALRECDHGLNLAQLKAISPNLLKSTASALDGRASLRCSSSDYLPIVGAAPIVADYAKNYAALGKDARLCIDTAASNYPKLYINVAHGSRGLTSTPVCAELLASYICGEVRPLPRHLCEALSPARFTMRRIIRNQKI
ncbi:bifunctional tRNA (5-methylaminomethyl-2-thiouridine)(34)-methyltransferase MnmD/FAD-dependent 5-carboxymethylaminomethyl-2-thiouridine(34) oxidoreductase MnmC [uncultured Zhongshania sp.]|uniref:bifunctional tRNA (5-methylaminomethyl-2-thiouridine)(34)-methyltransferase MnmD/FAD-dependent 5-carboxymethylaminomethyl-2-thiouridine(34) oxidoreductase MnmC n=1 Tax=uncultured Zhongshania sp. TaxID=1642288 RepID=UPI0030DC488C|tara:strand:- start:92393 stop:94456 length:2064 start_codon:yes stop_codon:yes gene_type:complete